MRLIQIVICICLSVGLHLIAFAQDLRSGPEASGGGGVTAITLAASSPSVEAMVQKWTAPPELMQDLPPPEVEQIAPPQDLLPEMPKAKSDLPLEVATMPPAMQREQPIDRAPAQAEAPPPPPPPKVQAPKPKPKKSQASAPARKKQQAKGKSKGANAGNSQHRAAASKNGGRSTSAEKIWGAGVSARIESNKRYPARAKGQIGRVRVRLTLAANGRLLRSSVIRSSGSRALDRAALSAVRRSKTYPKAPQGFRADSHTFNLTIRFTPPSK